MINQEFKKRVLSSIILLPISLFFIYKGSIFFIFFLFLLFLVSCSEWIKMCERVFITNCLGILFLIFSFYSTYYIRENLGYYLFIFLILICIFTDIGGYFFGKVFKGPKLTKISPNKTYSGVIGGFLLSLTLGLFYSQYINIDLFENDKIKIFIAILLISLISQLGDLIISYYKRRAKIKDTGKIIPGHGGILDRIDGLIFVLPFIYLYVQFLK